MLLFLDYRIPEKCVGVGVGVGVADEQIVARNSKESAPISDPRGLSGIRD